MDRDVIYTSEQIRGWDFVTAEFYAMVALASLASGLLGATTTVVSGLTASGTGTNLVVSFTSGQILQLAEADISTIGLIAANSNMILQQGQSDAQTITLSTAGITGGQSRYTLIQAQFDQVDNIPSNDPTGGNLPFYNSGNPASPIFSSGDTRRQGIVTIGTKNGTAATTGTEVPPNPDTGWVPLYLVDLAFGQTTLSTGQILVAGPSVGTNVPSNYPYAPFLAGLLNSHHSGNAGQAPKIHLDTEVQGLLPSANLAQNFGTIAGTHSVNTNTVFATTDFGYLLKYNETATGAGIFTLPAPQATGAFQVLNNSLYNLTLTVSGVTPYFQGFTDTAQYNPNAVSTVTVGPGEAVYLQAAGNAAWEVTYNSQFFGSAGNLAGTILISTTGTTTVASDQIGRSISLVSTAAGSATASIPQPTVQPGGVFIVDNNSNTYSLTIQATGGGAVFGGRTSTGNTGTVSSFTLPPNSNCTLYSRNGFWNVNYNSTVIDGYIAAVSGTPGVVGWAIAFQRASAFTPGTTYPGSTFTGLGYSGTWMCLSNWANGGNNVGDFVRIA